MAIAPRNQSRRQGSINLLQPPPPAPAQALGSVLGVLARHWRREGHLAALWQAWSPHPGPQPSQPGTPLRLKGPGLPLVPRPPPLL